MDVRQENSDNEQHEVGEVRTIGCQFVTTEEQIKINSKSKEPQD